MSGLTPRPRPCASCPYRRDVPSGVWAASQYELLRKYDGSIAEQAIAGAGQLFMCHQSDGHLCSGWTGCHDMHDILAAKLHAGELDDSAWDYVSPVPLFASGNEAADHGEAEIEHPSEEACEVIKKIVRVREARGNPVNYD